jgi:hypothetical protein
MLSAVSKLTPLPSLALFLAAATLRRMPNHNNNTTTNNTNRQPRLLLEL